MMNWILVVMAGIAATAIAMLVGGLVTPAEYTVHRTISLAASPARVLEALREVESWPVWTERALNVGIREDASSGNDLDHSAVSGTLRLEVIGDENRREGAFDFVVRPDGAGSAVECTETGRIRDPLRRFLRTHVIGLAGNANAALRCLAEQLDEFDRAPGARG